MIKQKKYAYYLIPKNIVNKQTYLVYFLQCMGLSKAVIDIPLISSDCLITRLITRPLCHKHLYMQGRVLDPPGAPGTTYYAPT